MGDDVGDVMFSGIADPRVQGGVEQVHQEVGDDEDEHEHGREGHDHGAVAADDGGVEGASHDRSVLFYQYSIDYSPLK